MTMEERERAAVLEQQAIAIERIHDACETYQRGGASYAHVVQLIEDVINAQTRIVRVGRTHNPEVKT